jgi:cytochrome c-type biogenesis protein CcmE
MSTEMKTDDSTKRVRWIVAFAVVSVMAVLIYVSWGDLGDNLVYYWTPGETLQKAAKLQNKEATIRLGGVVEKGSVAWNAEKLELRFKIADSPEAGAPSLLVDSKGAPPQMFREGIGVVVEGRLGGDGVFYSDRVMVNHSNEYRPPTGAEAKSGYGADSMKK